MYLEYNLHNDGSISHWEKWLTANYLYCKGFAWTDSYFWRARGSSTEQR